MGAEVCLFSVLAMLKMATIAGKDGEARVERDILDDCLNRHVAVCFHPHAAATGDAAEEGILLAHSPSGLLLEREDRTLVYIPLSSVRLVEIEPRPTFWQRITGAW